jgi:hypothetical protein
MDNNSSNAKLILLAVPDVVGGISPALKRTMNGFAKNIPEYMNEFVLNIL